MADVTLDGITKVYDDAEGTETAVDDVSFTLRDGELVVLVGPSGCGKSTTLRTVAGLETVTEGTITIGDREVQELGPGRRSVAMVFQSYALYSKMTALENIEYGLKHSTDLSKADRRERVREFAELLEIEDLLDDTPDELSGGQKQRVALGRAIVREPDVFLLDEPLSNLDAKLRATMRTELQRIQEEIGVTTLYVTHDQKEAMTMADRIAIMNDGVLQQIAPPEEAYDHPTNEFVATFLGSPSMNVLPVTVSEVDTEYVLRHDDVTVSRLPATQVPDLPDRVRIGLRPEHLALTNDPDDGTFQARVQITEYQGKDNFVHLAFGDSALTARSPPSISPDRHQRVGVDVPASDVYLFDPSSGETLKTRGMERVEAPKSK